MSANENEKLISIVLPNYNGKELLEFNLPFIYKAFKKGSFSFEIIVVDDCSTDNSVDFLQTDYPEIKVIKSDNNCGFSALDHPG